MRDLPRPSRRSFLAQVVGTSFASGGAFAAVTGLGFAQPPRRRSCLTDRDGTDQPQFGTLTGLTDRDAFDSAGRGTLDGVSDRDGTDRPGRGVSERCEAQRRAEFERTVEYLRPSPPGSTVGAARPSPPAASAPSRGRTPTSSSRSDTRAAAIPAFPWPPPAPSSQVRLPRTQFVDARNRRPSLFDVGQRLTAALERASYSEYSFYSVPNGFALVARLERFLDDGSRAPDTIRYLQPGDEPFSFTRYLTGLFVAPVGNYRQIAFIVTNFPFVASGKALSQEAAEQMLRRGANTLPSTYRRMRFGQDYAVTALVYEFQKRPREPALARPARGRLGARVHLERSGIEPALETATP